MRALFPKIIEKEIIRQKQLYILLGDIGVFSFRNIFKKFPKNITNIGLMEQSMISIAAGISMGGYIPIVHTIAPFLIERAYEQLKIDFGYQNLKGNFISVGGAFDYSGLGSTHHCPNDVNLISSIPNFQCILPGHSDEFKKLFKQTYLNNSPTYIRLTETPNLQSVKVKFGKANLIKNDGKLLILVVGDMLEDTIKATINLPVTILYYTTLKPFDRIAFKKYFFKNVILIGSFYSGIIENEILKSCDGKDINIESITVPFTFIHKYGRKEQLKKYLKIDKNVIKNRIINFLEKSG